MNIDFYQIFYGALKDIEPAIKENIINTLSSKNLDEDFEQVARTIINRNLNSILVHEFEKKWRENYHDIIKAKIIETIDRNGKRFEETIESRVKKYLNSRQFLEMIRSALISQIEVKIIPRLRFSEED